MPTGRFSRVRSIQSGSRPRNVRQMSAVSPFTSLSLGTTDKCTVSRRRLHTPAVSRGDAALIFAPAMRSLRARSNVPRDESVSLSENP